MKSIEDIHFRYEQLTDEQKNGFNTLANPLMDNTDFLFTPVPKYVDNITKQLTEDNRDKINNAIHGYQILMSMAYLHKRTGKKVVKFQNETVIKQLVSTDALTLHARDLGNRPFDTFYIDTKTVGINIEGLFVQFMGDILYLVVMKGEQFGMYEMIFNDDLLSAIADGGVQKAIQWSEKYGVTLPADHISMMRNEINFAMSTLFYLHCAISDANRIVETKPREHKKDAKINPKKEAIRSSRTYHTFLIKTSVSEQAEYATGEESLKRGVPLTLVRGHYRRQSIGSRESASYKTIWIKPFWRGNEEIADTMHLYKI